LTYKLSIADGGKDNDPEGMIQAIPKSKAEDLVKMALKKS
jgi:hypothetical protein